MTIRALIIFAVPFLIVQCTSHSNKRYVPESEKDTAPHMSNGIPKFEFTKEIHKFGMISEGEIAVCEFYYKNIGSGNLIISKIETNCGCAVVKWDKKPLRPGAGAKLSVEFNSEGRSGMQFKKITIFCNTIEGTKELVITAKVE